MDDKEETEQTVILNKLYQNYQQNIDSVTEDDFLEMKIPIEKIRSHLKLLESKNLVHIGERKGSGILMWIQITKNGIKLIEDSCGCS
ncbi:MAG: hypothetical protein R3327_05860 [Nitrosopumilaceae archaeon]|nr:hypothetical protein [Nitrosopumilaceae archaeon]